MLSKQLKQKVARKKRKKIHQEPDFGLSQRMRPLGQVRTRGSRAESGRWLSVRMKQGQHEIEAVTAPPRPNRAPCHPQVAPGLIPPMKGPRMNPRPNAMPTRPIFLRPLGRLRDVSDVSLATVNVTPPNAPAKSRETNHHPRSPRYDSPTRCCGRTGRRRPMRPPCSTSRIGPPPMAIRQPAPDGCEDKLHQRERTRR